MSRLKIDLYSDIVCPWCVIGQHRLDKVLSERFPNLDVDVEHHPYELMPHAPPEGLSLADYFRGKGITNMVHAFERPEGEARASGLHLDLSKQTYVYRTIYAHTLLRAARVRGTQHALASALMHAFFHERRNISDLETLSEIASHYGFQREEVHALLQDEAEIKKTETEIARTRNAGVSSVPTFKVRSLTIVGGRSEDEIATFINDAIHVRAEIH
ncbi:DsbA family protein [Collimonas sp.]|jgi:predicted DsbA family dithiol-disulfide isomerase|uniref:DsbA family oxidoreductase n=1 Tax=Collimonas sp. TaxID=1963772 RepID=UPI002D16F48C|nr:DsbA family protein [Collimonas sp.]HWX00071.1 DsbA family protein [Collimonas sp.]